MKLAIAGGGTGGHVFAGISIAQEFVSQSRANEAIFIGSDSGLETRLVPKAGFRLETLRLGKLVGQGMLRRLLTLLQIPFATWKCARILRREGVDAVVGVGGYAAGPAILAARFLGLPCAVLEQNAVMGLTNRLSARLAGHVFTAFEGIPPGVRPSKCTFTGNPVRVGLRAAAAKPAKPFVVFAFGGSQGASGINRMMTEAARELLPLKGELEISHQTGERDFERVERAYREMGFPAEVHRFIDDMQSRYNRASLVVCRAGSGTISELAATANAAILVPFPFAAQNHQLRNAELVRDAGAAEMLPQERDGRETPGTELAAMIRALMSDSSRLDRMRGNVARLAKPDAAARIVEILKIRALKRSR